MPFTLAHPAAALPLWYASGRRLRWAALVIGSTTPDYEYFFRMQAIGFGAHTPLGLLLFCLPVGWLALVLFDRFGRHGLEMLLPAGWQLPCAPPGRYDALWVSSALLLGAASHVDWDAFTHDHGAAVAQWPVLSAPVGLGASSVPLFKVLQTAAPCSVARCWV